MRIRTQYRVTLVLVAVVLVVVSASMLVIGGRIAAATSREMNATRVARGASDLGYLANDYVIYGEEGQRDAWRARFDSFSRDVSRLDMEDTPQEQALLRGIYTSQLHLKEVFESVVSAVERSRGARGAFDIESLKVSWSRLAVQAQALMSDATRLSRLERAEVERLSGADLMVAFAMLTALGLFYLATYVLLQRRIVKSIGALRSGAAIIGSGNLDFRVSARGNDEIGDLGRSFNAMTTSLEEMDRKVRQRTEELRQVNQTLRMVSECNQALARATEEVELVQEVCRVIQELGGYRMAWVGYAESDEAKSVRPVASTGVEDGYLRQARITWAEGQRGNGPTGRCIRERAVRIGSDFLVDPELAPWKGQAIERGFRSSVALPLVAGDEVLGALTIYSARPNDFGEEQVRLLEELAGDMSFGITALRARAERAAALRLAEERAVQLRALAAKLSHAEQKERRQLASVLHDDLQQLLVGGRYSLSVLEKEGREANEEEALRRGLNALDEAITLTRTLTGELSPPALHEKGIVAGIEWLGREMKRKHDLQVTVLADAFEEPADQDVRVFIYESVRELLFNVVKHAGTRAAEVGIARCAGGAIQIVVNDNGKGFDPEAITASGFGLLNIRERLGYLGGRIDAESAPGHGARFTLTVPTASVEAEPPRISPRAPILLDRGKIAAVVGSRERNDMTVRVLLVDDHQIIRQGLALLLCEEPDIEVVGEAGNGEEAVEMARRLLPDVVLMDVSIPGTNGVEATRRVVAENPNVRVIGLSMHEGADMEGTMRAAGATAYLTKDGPVDQLVAAIRSCRVG